MTAPTPLAAGVHTQPAFDVIEFLPPAAADRLRAMRQRSLDLHAVVPPFEEVRQASLARTEADNALQRLVSHPHQFGLGLARDHLSVKQAQGLLDRASGDLQRIKDRSEARALAWRACSAALSNVEGWLRDGRPHGTTLEVVEVEPPKLAKGEDVLSGIERLRRRGRELKATMHTIRSAPMPSSHAKAKCRAEIEALAQRGAPVVSNVIEHDRKIEWPTQDVRSEVHVERRSLAFAQVPDTLAIFAWMWRDLLIKRLDAEIDAEADDKAALSHEARQKAEAEMMGDLLAVERQEAALVWGAMDEKLPVEHRADISPLALLGLRLITAPRAGASPGSSTEHAYDIVMTGRR